MTLDGPPGTHRGVIGDAIHLGGPASTVSLDATKVVVSNTLYQHLPATFRAEFQELPPVEANGSSARTAPRRAITARIELEPPSG
jgi:hypothetical protein